MDGWLVSPERADPVIAIHQGGVLVIGIADQSTRPSEEATPHQNGDPEEDRDPNNHADVVLLNDSTDQANGHVDNHEPNNPCGDGS